ncbi:MULTISPECIES: peptidylprolyl isomerase [Tenacibaculum]|nr:MULTISPECIES: peptidylprolyl isomerase [Tenacibaculum]MCG7503100.1 peptidylprolyl isomerase [Tenacibaculum sp. Mcav3-52]MCO7185351.1 peptidylprolyl isomerase [Tenacibaculum sp. XPcli2-G]GFD74478.1 peptidylprolyl isomerase [Tenacibaculum sp. KUL113]GFD79248.1 peptidylprolyl isomerase [Tenacibaculum sp. KUL118]|eukprot:TRINITY_DN921_c0_g1_i4.p2 TRINITY_DN921_c0_g1~~TRINITY_DN921_c0_g1_i4.p2  ORF type:complete len:459 (+),score=128.20 TRINITY_DN921_c0_g1_i4:6204-7580(+)
MMQLKTRTLKNISIVFTLFLAGLTTVNAQGTKVDGVAVVVGKNIVLDSDIDKFKQEVELRSEGKVKISDCEMLEELMQQKLLAHHAIIDSVTVSQSEIDSRVDRSIAFFTQEYGSEEKVVEAYGFNDVEDLKKELGRVQRENLLIEKEQQKITENIDVTPEEIRIYFKGLQDKGELPEIPAEVQLQQLVVKAEPTEEEKERVINKLKEIKKEIENGASFKLKAIINSEDPGVAQNGGKYVITKDSPFIKEFKETAFSLDVNQISEPIKSAFGYHILQLHKIKGNQREVSHILMQPEVSDEKLNETKEQIEKIVADIKEEKITFEEAVKKYSEDEETKNSAGIIMNPYTQEPTFELTRMPPELFARISELKKGDLSDIFYDETREGEKMYKVILLKDKTDTHKADLVDDYVRMQEFALAKKKEEEITKWTKDKIQETYLKLSNDYKKCTFKKDWKKENK